MDRFNIFSLLREKIASMRVSVRNRSNACVSRKMRESWKVWQCQSATPAGSDSGTNNILFCVISPTWLPSRLEKFRLWRKLISCAKIFVIAKICAKCLSVEKLRRNCAKSAQIIRKSRLTCQLCSIVNCLQVYLSTFRNIVIIKLNSKTCCYPILSLSDRKINW